jgi:SAM-dependent methyltransferase
VSTAYDAIGQRYSATRRTDPRIAAQLFAALGDARTILNVGAGTGNYEPDDRSVIALDPSLTMLKQRRAEAAPCVCGMAETLPFRDHAFDAALAILTVHHWGDMQRGIDELRRVSDRQVVLTFEPSFTAELWLVCDYFPEVVDLPTERRLPDTETLRRWFGVPTTVAPVLIADDCIDGFAGCYWNRPEAYLDPHIQDGMSMFAHLDPAARRRGTEQLRADLASGRWDEKYGASRRQTEIDLGYRLLSSSRLRRRWPDR